eukprot:7339372-Prorocentrum_lima.AAC.1
MQGGAALQRPSRQPRTPTGAPDAAQQDHAEADLQGREAEHRRRPRPTRRAATPTAAGPTRPASWTAPVGPGTRTQPTRQGEEQAPPSAGPGSTYCSTPDPTEWTHAPPGGPSPGNPGAVSYTHLTLPTICSV